MKKLALLLLALPFATSLPLVAGEEPQQTVLTTAQAFCARNQIAPSDPHYLACIDIYLSAHSNLFAKPMADGALRATYVPIFPHSTFHPLGGRNVLCRNFVFAHTAPGEFQKCLDRIFALECRDRNVFSGSYELPMLGACDWKTNPRAE